MPAVVLSINLVTEQPKAVQEEECVQLSDVKRGSILRLNHVETGKWLHSHLHASPLTQNQEVSAYGAPIKSDTGDYWRISWDDTSPTWHRGLVVR
jgi:dolichyl-phosphate-mannose--protein O-mannosyl transferase